MVRRTKREQEQYDRGFRHGHDGICYYPFPASTDLHYRQGYIAGRRHYKSVIGVYPRSGNRFWDKED